MVKSILLKSLSRLDLTGIESQLYCTLLDTQEINIKKFAEELGVQRKRIYQSLDKLEQIGLITRDPKTDKRIVQPPSKVSQLLNLRAAKTKNIDSDLQKVLPELMGNYYSKHDNKKVRVYENIESFVDVLDEFTKVSEGEIWCLGSPNILDFAPEYMSWYIDKRSKAGVVSNSIMFENSTLRQRNHDKDLRPIKWIPDKFKGDAAYIVFDNKVAIWNALAPRIVVIEDQIIADFFKTVYKLVWERL